MRYIYRHWPTKASPHLKPKRQAVEPYAQEGLRVQCLGERDDPLSDSVGHCPFPIPRSPLHTAASTASFHSSHFPPSPSFLLPTLSFGFLPSLPGAPIPGTQKALVCGSQAQEPWRLLGPGVGTSAPRMSPRASDPCCVSQADQALRTQPQPAWPTSAQVTWVLRSGPRVC